MKKEKWIPAVGDRVAVYWHDERLTGRITEATEKGILFVEFDTGLTKYVHPKQCRRLVPKKKRDGRTFWLTICDRRIFADFIKPAHGLTLRKDCEEIEVQEVLNK